MTAPYREFEKLVSRIEGALVPRGAQIKSPDKLVDKFTGELREVDVSIRHKVGSVELLVTVECRDRIKIQDVTWIEQLATKQKQIGADHTIAVSSAGFSEPALAAARMHGISARIVDDITDNEIPEWVEGLEVEEVETQCLVGPLVLTYFENTQDPMLDALSLQLWDELKLEGTDFHRPCDQCIPDLGKSG